MEKNPPANGPNTREALPPPLYEVVARSAAAETHQDRNDDAYVALPSGLIAVLDGMSAHAGSNQASQIGAATVDELLAAAAPDDLYPKMRNTFNVAHQRIFAANSEIDTTATVAWVIPLFEGDVPETEQEHITMIGHTGDSRLYVRRYETGETECLTIDQGIHSNGDTEEDRWHQDQIDQIATVEDLLTYCAGGQGRLERFNNRHKLRSGLGTAAEPEVHLSYTVLKPGDVLFALTDGISNNLTKSELYERFAQIDSRSLLAVTMGILNASVNRSHETNHLRRTVDDMTIVALRIPFMYEQYGIIA